MGTIKYTTFLKDGWITLHVEDLYGDEHHFDVKQADYHAYEDGELIQNCFPYLTMEQREIILSGMTQDMWDEMFGGEEI